jgi:D-isomer specific 2-hydroxyacid dehydrogenase, NAD binding domain
MLERIEEALHADLAPFRKEIAALIESLDAHALVHLRQLRRYERQRRECLWADDDKQPKAGDAQVSVLGLGVMGKDAAAKLNALGFKVAGWSASPKSLPVCLLFRRGGLEAPLGANRHAGRAAAAD